MEDLSENTPISPSRPDEIQNTAVEAETTAITDNKADRPWLFKPGVSGNPAGKPKGKRNFTTRIRESLEKIAEGQGFTYEEALVKTVLHKAIVEKDPNMIRLIWNYLDGMPHQTTDMTLGIKPIPILGHVQIDDSNQEDSQAEEENKSDTGGNGSQ